MKCAGVPAAKSSGSVETARMASTAMKAPGGVTTTTLSGLHPPGALPSASSQMICSTEAVKDIGVSLGVNATVSKPTWVDHVYACPPPP